MSETETPPTTREIAEAVLLDADQRKRLLSYARSHFGIGTEDVEDLLQETALELLRQRTLVHNPNGFAFTVFRSRCCRFVKAHQAYRAIFGDEDCHFKGAPHPLGPEKIDSRLAMRQAFGEISASCRKLLVAYYVEGKSLREAAQTTARAYSGVWRRINRCLGRLRKCLA